MKIALVGDVHGGTTDALTAIYHAADMGAERIIFLGDFGYNFTDSFVYELTIAGAACGLIIEWIDGNHENFDKLQSLGFDLGPQFKYHPRGSTEEIDGVKFMFVGGATSVDRQYRDIGRSWWPQEALTFGEIASAFDKAPGTSVMLMHDAPYLPPMMDDSKSSFPRVDLAISAAHRTLIKIVYKEAKPKFVFHGHFHVPYIDVHAEPWGETTIQGLNCSGNPLSEYMTIIDTEEMK
jgi:predicted phosphodiesterase